MPSDYTPDQHSLPDEPGAKVNSGTAGKVKQVPRKTFNESIGHGSASGGQGQTSGTGGTGDPTIQYKNQMTWARNMGRGGRFGTPYHDGKKPLDYEYDLSAFLLEY